VDDDGRVEHVFLVRMWLERGGGEAQWRGSVQHVATGRRMFVGSPGEVGDFIALQLPVKTAGAEGRG
jgi:hypothetical protein